MRRGMDYLVNSAWRDVKVSAEFILTDVQRLEEFLKQNLARMYGAYLLHRITSMIINNFNVVCISFLPFKTYPPLIVNSCTVYI